MNDSNTLLIDQILTFIETCQKSYLNGNISLKQYQSLVNIKVDYLNRLLHEKNMV